MLSKEDKILLLRLARESLEGELGLREKVKPDAGSLSSILKEKMGAFVSLHTKDKKKLRGCIGRFRADKELYLTVMDMAVSSGLRDHRFTPLLPLELDEIEIEISVLGVLQSIESKDEIIPGKHGIYIKKGGQSGTFLPQVATEQAWDVDEFLGNCSKYKAGLGWEGWKEAELYVYEAHVFSESDIFH